MMIFLSFDIALLNDKNREYKENHNVELNDKNKFLETRYPSILLSFFTLNGKLMLYNSKNLK